MITNITNLSGLIRGYVINNVQRKYPNLDITENSSFDDLFIKPMIELLLPLFEKLNSSEMMRNLDNAEYMSEDELDRVGEGNYFITRKGGSKASTVLTLSFASAYEGESITIPASVIFQTGEGLQFQTLNRKVFTYEELLPLYNVSTMTYDLPVEVEAAGVGSVYNVDPETITISTILFNTTLLSITNKDAVTNGTDKETNVDYADRMRTFYVSRQLGTKPGYEQFILENFEEVEDVHVEGYQDEFMVRDIINVYDIDTQQYFTRHIGGMIDIYIKGYMYGLETTEIALKTNYLVLSIDYDLIVPGSVSVINNTDGTRVPVISSTDLYSPNGENKMAVVLDNTDEQSFSTSADSEIYIIYDYTDSESNIVNQVDNFIIGDLITDLSTPMKEIVSIQNSEEEVIDNIGEHYELIRDGEQGTTVEKCSLRLLGFDSVPNGSIIKINYTINTTLKSMNEIFNKEEYRLVTADIIVKEASSVPVNIAFEVKMKEGYTLDKIKSAKIRASVTNFFNEKNLSDDIEESDIVAWVKTDADIRNYIEYIVLPFTSFYVPADISVPIEQIRDSTNLAVEKIAYPILNKINITEMI